VRKCGGGHSTPGIAHNTDSETFIFPVDYTILVGIESGKERLTCTFAVREQKQGLAFAPAAVFNKPRQLLAQRPKIGVGTIGTFEGPSQT